jgi:hypothetical protein
MSCWDDTMGWMDGGVVNRYGDGGVKGEGAKKKGTLRP